MLLKYGCSAWALAISSQRIYQLQWRSLLCSIYAPLTIRELEEHEKEVPSHPSSDIQFFFWAGQLDSDDHYSVVNS